MYSSDAPQIIETHNIGVQFTPHDVRWHPSLPRFVGMGQNPRGTGAVNVYELGLRQSDSVSSELKPKHVIECPAGIKCGTFGAAVNASASHIAIGDMAGGLNIIAHASTINAIDGCGGLGIGHGSPELVTGSQDGHVRVWDPRVPEAVLTLEPTASVHQNGVGAGAGGVRDCWTVAFGNSFDDTERCIAAGYDNGDIKLFDLRTSRMRWEDNAGNGVVSLEFDRRDIAMNKLVATTLESRFRVYDMRTQHPEHGFAYLSEKVHKATVWLGRHLPQDRDVFLTAGGNGGLNLYKYVYPTKRTQQAEDGAQEGVMGRVELLNARVVSSQPVVAWDWCTGKTGLAAAACLDQTLRVFVVTKLGAN